MKRFLSRESRRVWFLFFFHMPLMYVVVRISRTSHISAIDALVEYEGIPSEEEGTLESRTIEILRYSMALLVLWLIWITRSPLMPESGFVHLDCNIRKAAKNFLNSQAVKFMWVCLIEQVKRSVLLMHIRVAIPRISCDRLLESHFSSELYTSLQRYMPPFKAIK